MFKVYILFSQSLDRYYTGRTGDNIDERIRRHNSKHAGYTGSVCDWKLVWIEDNLSKEKAIERELQIKRWKSRKKIQTLIEKKL
jgi:putative endonuclease